MGWQVNQVSGPCTFSDRLSRRSALRTVSSGLCAALSCCGTRSARAHTESLLEEAYSPFNHIQVTEKGSIRTLYFVVEGVRYIESRWDMAHPKALDLDYSRTMMAGFLLQPQPKRMMLMGLGGGQISNYLFERFPDLEIDAVEIDPEVVRLARKYFAVPTHPRYRTVVEDGRVAIEKSGKKWGLIMLDAFRGVFVPAHLKTKEFYQLCLEHLTEDGVVVANLHNQSQMYSHDRQTLASVFPQRYSFVSESQNQTTFVAAANTQRVGAYAIRKHASSLQANFDFDLRGLAARYYLRCDWDDSAGILRDDFPPTQLEEAAKRHNQTCVRGCAYQAG